MSSREISKGENTRRKIIRTALGLAARHGFAETSFQMIADELKLSQSAVMYHFASKNELVEELIKTIISHNHETVAGLMDPADDAGRRLLKYCLGNLLWALNYRKDEGQILILLYYFSSREKNFSELFERMMAGGRERIIEHLLAGRREGLFSLKDAPAAAAAALQDNLFGAMLYAVSAEKAPSPEDLENKARLLAASFTGWSEAGQSPLLPKLRSGLKH